MRFLTSSELTQLFENGLVKTVFDLPSFVVCDRVPCPAVLEYVFEQPNSVRLKVQYATYELMMDSNSMFIPSKYKAKTYMIYRFKPVISQRARDYTTELWTAWGTAVPETQATP